jgi:hypothetical protein
MTKFFSMILSGIAAIAALKFLVIPVLLALAGMMNHILAALD